MWLDEQKGSIAILCLLCTDVGPVRKLRSNQHLSGTTLKDIILASNELINFDRRNVTSPSQRTQLSLKSMLCQSAGTGATHRTQLIAHSGLTKPA